ncbi:tRNA (adenosine(37)-N6)-dimethylallyltransferase MiaA [Sphingobacterium griseoflavum]|uniref:tRNA dimethylallyltransferase n=1 Tax=Sphingobacterium griseoflavum TaxID=1474952 RepID=A0ABQ3HXS6_9SPHI|nr:tRNA (adenosine(37)-N6)-dimethylallyltransferase MiaA [Sphingobacterium griseoflavum]GHE29970.1 tRNA dimethylallyltransferase 2 [Sphingobacterium griseoflavum]
MIGPSARKRDIIKEGNGTPPPFLTIILGPTASGKTSLGVSLAEKLSGEIISIDSRQVYRGMDIGTGKDLHAYRDIRHHLIDIRHPQQRYDIAQFQNDFHEAYSDIVSRGKTPVAVGGTGMYILSLLIPQPYIQTPVNQALRDQLSTCDKQALIRRLQDYVVPNDFHIDQSSQKRLIRAIEILEALKQGFLPVEERPAYMPRVFGLNPELDVRRARISDRLRKRLDTGLIGEVEKLLQGGLSHADLQYYGLEYKYASLYLLGELDKPAFHKKLETEIHRYAKRQMTFFRKMEKEGVAIHWLRTKTEAAQVCEILESLERTPILQ